jgi:putative DNA primase/helicase
VFTGAKFSKENIEEGMRLAADKAKHHPVQQYLREQLWDGVERIDTWLIDHFGVIDDPSGYARAVGRKWLISAVGRAMNPGCKADCMLIIEGPQGIGKSPALDTLAGHGWFKDSPLDFRSKDRFTALRGVWIYELAEFDQYKGVDAAMIKSYTGSRVDTYRPPYAEFDIEQPRGVIFAGTTNKSQYLTDDTGDKRFWPVRCVRHTKARPINITGKGGIAEMRDQLWAEAVRAYDSGENAYLDDALIQEAHEREGAQRHDNEHTWEEPIMKWINGLPVGKDGRARISTGDMLTLGLNIPLDRHTRPIMGQVRGIMERAGYKYGVKRLAVCGGASIKTWFKDYPGDQLTIG